jgi:quinol monooxygenase YgiN
MTVKLGLLAQLEAKPGKGDELRAFLESGRTLALAEEGTVTWYAFKLDDTHYGIFDTFETEDARQAHINGEIPKALTQVAADLLASEPDIRPDRSQVVPRAASSSTKRQRKRRDISRFVPGRPALHLHGMGVQCGSRPGCASSRSPVWTRGQARATQRGLDRLVEGRGDRRRAVAPADLRRALGGQCAGALGLLCHCSQQLRGVLDVGLRPALVGRVGAPPGSIAHRYELVVDQKRRAMKVVELTAEARCHYRFAVGRGIEAAQPPSLAVAQRYEAVAP